MKQLYWTPHTPSSAQKQHEALSQKTGKQKGGRVRRAEPILEKLSKNRRGEAPVEASPLRYAIRAVA